MLQIVSPVSNVPVSVGEMFGAFSVHFSAFEISFVSAFIGPDHYTFAVHIIVLKLALIKLSTIRKVIFAIPMKLAINEVSLIVPPFELKPSISGLFAINKHSRILDLIIVPALCAVSMLLVIDPLSLIHGTIGVHKDTVAVGFSI